MNVLTGGRPLLAACAWPQQHNLHYTLGYLILLVTKVKLACVLYVVQITPNELPQYVPAFYVD